MPKKKFVFNLVLLGDVAAGKATQSAHFAKKYKMRDFDMGKELNIRRVKNKAIDVAQSRTGDKGILTPTKICQKIDRDTINSTPVSKGILFDGHPKMVVEAELIDKLLRTKKRTKPLVIYIKLPLEESVRRIAKRKGYLGTRYNKRSDDSPAVLKKRTSYYKRNIVGVVKFFQSKYAVSHIDGLGTQTQVRARIQKAIDFYLKNYDQIYQTTGRD